MPPLPRPATSTPVNSSLVAPTARLRALEQLLGMLVPMPAEWLSGGPRGLKRDTQLQPLPCTTYCEVVTAWRKAMRWTQGLDRALSVMLATVVSTEFAGEQLWTKVLGPPSTGKTSLAEGLGVCRKYVKMVDTFRGLTSGFQTDAEGKENYSLVGKLQDKTLLINDGDTLLKLPNRDEILSQLRAFYSRNLRTSYKNRMSKDFEGINTTVIICGTQALRELDASELGARFLDCVIMESIEEQLELEIAKRAVYQADRNMLGADDVIAGKGPEVRQAQQLTGGYIVHLRENSQKMLEEVDISPPVKDRCIELGVFVSYLRARPGKKQEVAERELSARLAVQFMKLTRCLSAVLNKTEADGEIVNRVTKVAIDSAQGKLLDIARALYRSKTGLRVKDISNTVNESVPAATKHLRFMRSIGAVERYYPPKTQGGVQPVERNRLTAKMATLYESVMRGLL